jgi:hypothetical protein
LSGKKEKKMTIRKLETESGFEEETTICLTKHQAEIVSEALVWMTKKLPPSLLEGFAPGVYETLQEAQYRIEGQR